MFNSGVFGLWLYSEKEKNVVSDVQEPEKVDMS